MKWIDLIVNLPTNTAVGLACALFSMLINTDPKRIGLRNYVFVFVLNLFITGLVIDLFLHNALWWWCGIAGLLIGWAIDELYLNLETVLPELVSGTIADTVRAIRKKIKHFLGIEPNDKP